MQYTLHGENILDNAGNLIKNAGGDVFQPVTINDPDFAYLLAGKVTKQLMLYAELEYQIIMGYYLTFHMNYFNFKTDEIMHKYFQFWGQLTVSFN